MNKWRPRLQLKNIPKDSLIQHWCRYLSLTEVPFSYQVAAGLTAIGAIIRRTRWVDQLEFKVWPCQPVLFIGPSGIGKDTIINRVVRTMDYFPQVPTLGGATYEGIAYRLAQMGKPACAYIPAQELTAFFGKSEYQQSMLAGMTNILSCGDKIDITTKGAMVDKEGHYNNRALCIYSPTVTMHGGSTVEWLHKQMPDGTLEGGFLGRFLIVCEESPARHIPLIKYGMSTDEVKNARGHLDLWHNGLKEIEESCKAKPQEVHILPDAEDMYGNWYHNRFKLFSRAVMPYANRSRDMVLRLAMLMAISRQHTRYIEDVDMEFAIAFIKEVAQKIDKVVIPPAKTALIAMRAMEMIPCREDVLFEALGQRHDPRDLIGALELLRKSGKAWYNVETKSWEPMKEASIESSNS